MPHRPHLALLTEGRYERPRVASEYVANVLEEDRLLAAALAARGIDATRIDWARADADWARFDGGVFRTTWDYFERFAEFSRWLDAIEPRTRLWNPAATIRWNADKHYLADLDRRGVPVVPTVFVERGAHTGLAELMRAHGFDRAVLKPAVSGAARHTYVVERGGEAPHEPLFRALVDAEAMLLQPFQRDVVARGELAIVVIDGTCTHAVRKLAKPGDFRVQDDHGGTAHAERAGDDELALAARAVAACDPAPLYARVDVVRTNDGALAVMELELIEPELWLRLCPAAAERLAEALARRLG